MDEIEHEELVLKWENHQRTIVTALDSLLNYGTFADCTLAAEGKFIEAHRFVLSACSPYISTIFSQKCDKHPIVVLHGIKFEELRVLLDYMYKGEVIIIHDQLPALINAAESLQIKGLSRRRSESKQGDDDLQRQDTDQIKDDVIAGQDNIPLQVNCENHTQQENTQLVPSEQLQANSLPKAILRSKKIIPSDNDTEYDSSGRPEQKIQLKRKSNVDRTKSTPLKKATMSQDVPTDFETDLSKRFVQSTSLNIPKTSYEADNASDNSSEPETCKQKRRHAATNFRVGSESVVQFNDSGILLDYDKERFC